MLPLTDDDPREIGRYRIEAVLGEGGMGRVYLGAGPDGQQVAIKRILPQLSSDPGFRARFALEVAAARKVSGPHTVPVVDADTEADEPWLATEYLPGPTLTETIDTTGRLDEEAVRQLGISLASALRDIHAAGLIHRDVKPSNVLMSPNGAKLLDFGISRAREYSTTVALTQTGGVVGSPAYMSPEQAESRSLTEKSDVFGLGCLLAVAASGKPAFDAPSIPQIMYQVVYGRPDLDGVPASLRGIIERCLAKNPEDRPAAAEVGAVLANPAMATAPTLVDDGETLVLGDRVPPLPGRAGVGRKPALVMGVVLAAVLLLATPLWFLLDGSDTPPPDDKPSETMAEAEEVLKMPTNVCPAFDEQGLLRVLGSEYEIDEDYPESMHPAKGVTLCYVIASSEDDLEGYSFTIRVARADADVDGWGVPVTCMFDGCDESGTLDDVEPDAMPYGESDERPWDRGAILESSLGLSMAWYQGDVTVEIGSLLGLDDGSEAERDFLLDQGIAVYDFIASS